MTFLVWLGMTIILITGGARSGKSRIAEQKALSFNPRATYIATGQPLDAEMAARIKAHQYRRGPQWTTLCEPFDLAGALARTDGTGPRLVDCLTMWLSNIMLDGWDWERAAQTLIGVLARQKDPVVLVTNEVGSAIVPDNQLARAFRDAAGTLNQQVADAASEVYLAVCGLPLQLRGPAPHEAGIL